MRFGPHAPEQAVEGTDWQTGPGAPVLQLQGGSWVLVSRQPEGWLARALWRLWAWIWDVEPTLVVGWLETPENVWFAREVSTLVSFWASHGLVNQTLLLEGKWGVLSIRDRMEPNPSRALEALGRQWPMQTGLVAIPAWVLLEGEV